MPKFSEILDKLEGEIITTSKQAAGILSETLAVIDNELKTDITAIMPVIKNDIKDIIKNGIPIIWPLITSGSAPMAIIMAGYDYFKSQLPHLCEEVWMVLASELSSKVKNIVPAPEIAISAPIPSPTIISTAEM